MSGSQSMIAVGGLGLVGATFWKSKQRPAINSLIWDGKATPDTKSALMQVAGELVLILLLYMLAGQSDGMGTAMVVVVLTLWILFFITIYAPTAKKG